MKSFYEFDEMSEVLFRNGWSVEEITFRKCYRLVPPNGHKFVDFLGSGSFTVSVENENDMKKVKDLVERVQNA